MVFRGTQYQSLVSACTHICTHMHVHTHPHVPIPTHTTYAHIIGKMAEITFILMFVYLFGKTYLVFHTVLIHISIIINKDKVHITNDNLHGYTNCFPLLFQCYCSTCILLLNTDLRVISWQGYSCKKEEKTENKHNTLKFMELNKTTILWTFTLDCYFPCLLSP